MTIVPPPNHLISLLTDYGFKITFANEKNRTFLRKALQLLIKSPFAIKRIRHLPTEIKGITEEGRRGLYDTVCLADSDLYFIVEMQVGNYNHLIERLLYYVCHLYIAQVEKGIDGFSDIKKVHCICITKDSIFKDVKEYYHKSSFTSETGMKITDKMELIFVELEKFTKLAVDIDNEFDELIFTMKNAHTIDISKPIEVPLFWGKDWLQGVIKELNLSTMSPQNRALYNISIGRLIAINEQNEIDRQEMRQEVREEVKEEVREEVKEEVREEVKEEVREEVKEEVREEVKEEVKLDIKAEAIQKALKAGKLTIEEVADYNDVTVEFVLKVKEGMDKTIQ